MKDFACCGKTLPTLHDLLQHYEECHAQQTPQSMRTASAAARARENSTPNSKAAIASQASSAVQQQTQHQNLQPQRPQGLQMPPGGPSVGGIQLMRQQQQSQPSTPVQNNVQPMADTEMEGVEDMEMDDEIGPLDNPPDTPVQQNQQPVQPTQPSLFGQPQRPTLNLNSSGMSGLRTSQPTTPATSGFGFQHNPTVSSVNTPTLSAQPIQQHQPQPPFSAESSIPGTPVEMDDDFSNMPMNMGMGNMNFNYPFGGNEMGIDLCIDEPAKRLYSPNGGFNNQRTLQQQFSQFGLGQGQGQNQDLMRAYQQQQLMAHMGNTQAVQVAMMMQQEEHKPFRCPVIGCEKAYKNQNGLK